MEKSNKIPVHPRAPYGESSSRLNIDNFVHYSNFTLPGGQLVVCAFSGSHQDAIKKGFAARKASKAKDKDYWQLPYLPLNPYNIRRTYKAIIQVNSQSRKGGAAWVILRNLNLNLPHRLQIAFSKIVQREADRLSRELKPTEITHLFKESYHLKSTPRYKLLDYDISVDRSASPAPRAAPIQSSRNPKRIFKGIIAINGKEHHLTGAGNGAISSLTNTLNTSLRIVLDVTEYKEHAIGKGKDVKAATYIKCNVDENEQQKVWGVGIHEDVVQASLVALLNASSSIGDQPAARIES